MRADGPAEQPGERGTRCRDPPSERALRGLGLVDDRDQLEVRLTEWHDPVRRAPTGVTAALDRRQAMSRFELLRGCGKVGHRDQYVVELQSDERSRPAITGQASFPTSCGSWSNFKRLVIPNAAPTCTTHCSRSAAASSAIADSRAQSEMPSWLISTSRQSAFASRICSIV